MTISTKTQNIIIAVKTSNLTELYHHWGLKTVAVVTHQHTTVWNHNAATATFFKLFTHNSEKKLK
jgi:hypothetical protein